jgi:type II secretory pathway component PulC
LRGEVAPIADREGRVSLIRLLSEGLGTACLAVVCAQLVWLGAVRDVVRLPASSTMTASGFSTEPSANVGAVGEQVGNGSANITLLSERSLFGSGNALTVFRATKAVPVSSLGIEIRGLRASREGLGTATIRLPNGTEMAAREGDPIVDGVTLERVDAHAILLRRNGALERVDWVRPRAFLGQANDGSSPDAAGRPLSEAIPGGLADLMSLITLQPLEHPGVGLRVAVLNELPAAFSEIEDGDVLREVNGVKVKTLAEALAVLGKLTNSDTVNLRIERSGVALDVLLRRKPSAEPGDVEEK